MFLRRLGLSLASCVLAANAFAQRIYVNVPAFTEYLDRPSHLSLTGEFGGCAWRPVCLKLKKYGSDHNAYYVDVDLPVGVKIDFKITRGGSWESEAADYEGKAVANFTSVFPAADSNVIVTVYNWKDNGLFSEGGRLSEHPSPKSTYLSQKNQRSLFIWTPPGYDPNRSEPYPLVFAQDGENIFNSIVALGGSGSGRVTTHSPAGTNWQLDSTLPYLIKKGLIPELIVVGISSYGSVGRRSEYAPGYPEGNAYISFLALEILPFIKKLGYHVSEERRDRFLMGSSLGGLVSLGTLAQFPGLFGGAAALSLAGDGARYAQFLANGLKENSRQPGLLRSYFPDSFLKYAADHLGNYLKSRVYIDHGLMESDLYYKEKAYPTVKTLLALPFLSVQYHLFPLAGHQEAHWARNVDQALRFLFARHVPPVQ